MLGRVHMEKSALHCIGKYIRRSGLGEYLFEPQVFGIKVLESAFSGKNYVRALQILQCSLEVIKWSNYEGVIGHITLVREVMINREPGTCKELFKKHYEIEALHIEFQNFTKYCIERSEICYFGEMLFAPIGMVIGKVTYTLLKSL